MRNPKFNALLQHMAELHDRKNSDYAVDGSPYSNFEFAAKYAGVGVDVVFDVLLGIKQARLNALYANGRDPKNESVQDTLIDRAVYAALAASYHMEVKDGERNVEGDLSKQGSPNHDRLSGC